MNRWHLGVSIAAIALFGFLFSQDTLARLAWQRFNRPDLAALLVRRDSELAFKIGNYYFNVNGSGAYDLGAAERHYRRAMALDPKHLGARYQLSRIAFLRGDFGRALDAANEIAKDHPEFTRVHYLRGLIHGYAGNLDAAAADFAEFLEWDSKSWAAHNDLAWVYFRQGNFAEAEVTARRGLAWNPENPWLRTTLGVSLLNVGKKTEAQTTLSNALEAAERLSTEDWGRAYPGNDPRTYRKGLEEMKRVIQANLELANP